MLVGPSGEVSGAEVPNTQNCRLRPLRTRVPAAEAVAVAALRGTSWAVPLTLSRPAAPTAIRPPSSPAGPTGQRDRARRPFPLGRDRRGRQAAQTMGPAAPGAAGAEAGPRLPPSLSSPQSASQHPESPLPRQDPSAAPGPPLRSRSAGSAGEAAARQCRGGGGGRHHVCPPLPDAGCPADKARRRRRRSGRPGRPRRPPRNKRVREPRKPGALMQ